MFIIPLIGRISPAYKSLLTALTYMFLHGSVGHLFGNMVFLWIVGCMLEMGLGRLLYMGLYIFGGVVAAGVFCLIYMNSTVPVVGASGAIAGLMGALAVLFGEKRIKIFYSLTHLFNASKLDPEAEEFHRTAKKLIFQLSRCNHSYEKANKIYQEYIGLTRRPRLSPQIYLQLSTMFSTTGHLESAVKIITLLLKKMPESPGIPAALLKLARAYCQNGMTLKGDKCMQLLCHKYAASIEAQVARKTLRNRS
jgi:tetratricopeptide (TPR) repeat protein